MNDQAAKLRQRMVQAIDQSRNETGARQHLSLARTIAVVSGKGGVGKTNISVNFALELARNRKKVMLLDMDLGMGNVHIILGQQPKFSLKDYLVGNALIEETITPYNTHLDYIAGGSGLDDIIEWTDEIVERLMIVFDEMQKTYDYIIFDMGAGATKRTIELIGAVDDIIVVATPEPTSITDAYSMMKYIVMNDFDKPLHIITNRVQNNKQMKQVSHRLQYAMKNFLKKETVVLGNLQEDPLMTEAVIAQKPFTELKPNATLSKQLTQITQAFIGNPFERVEEPNHFIQKLKGFFMKGSR